MQADLKKLHVPVVATAEDMPAGDGPVASDQETQTIGLRFKKRWGQCGNRCRRLRVDDLAASAAGPPEHVQAHVHRHQ